MDFVAIVLLGMWLYAIGSLITLPCKIFGMKKHSQDVWAFLTRGNYSSNRLRIAPRLSNPLSAGSKLRGSCASVPQFLGRAIPTQVSLS